MKIKIHLELFFIFFKIGLISFGGGYTVVPLLQRELVENREWVSEEELMDIMAISQSFPGAIMVNSSTMVGYKVGGILGSITATLASVLPTFAIILIITSLFWRFTELKLVKKAFFGILLGVTALILYSVIKTWKLSVKGVYDITVVLASLSMLIFFKINAVYIIIGAILAGLLKSRILHGGSE